MEERIKNALEKFEDGYDCSHAVLSSFADVFHFDEKSLRSIRSPCSSLPGRPRDMCGAVSGALKALCQKMYEEDHIEHKITEEDLPLIHEFEERTAA